MGVRPFCYNKSRSNHFVVHRFQDAADHFYARALRKDAFMQPMSLDELGWQPFFENQISVEESQTCCIGRVSAHHGGQILLLTPAGEISVSTSILETDEDGLPAPASGVSSIAVGDWFLLQPEDYRVIRRLERKTKLMRKASGETVKPQLIAANIDTVFIVSSCNLDFNLSRLERYLALVLESGAFPVVVLTKADLVNDVASLRQQVERLHSGLVVETVDARDADQTTELGVWCGKGKTVSLLGSSGVGKSTLANSLGDHHLSTSPAREADDKGRHTTTARSLHPLRNGAWLIDNPGIRELQLPACEDGVADLFSDVLEFAQHCKFRNCSHQGDAGCAIEQAVEDGLIEERRVRNFLKLQSEQERNSRTLAERREKERKQGQFYKSVIQEKKRRRNNP